MSTDAAARASAPPADRAAQPKVANQASSTRSAARANAAASDGWSERRHETAAVSFMARAVSVGIVAMLVQGMGVIVAETPNMDLWWNLAFGLPIIVSALVVVAIGLTGRAHRLALSVFVVMLTLGLVFWPLAAPAENLDLPWLWHLVGVSVACVALAWGARPSFLYTVVISTVWAIVRSLPVGGAGGWQEAVSDSLVLLVSGSILITAIQAIRVGAARADASALAAAQAHRSSAIARARLTERNRLAAILHDWVLTALVSASRARTPAERQSAAELAANALQRLAEDQLDRIDLPVPLQGLPGLIGSIVEADEILPADLIVELPRDAAGELPAPVAEALLAATYAALANASRHSGASRVEIGISLTSDRSKVAVVVADQGCGFDPNKVRSRCLGIRLSIMQRMRDIGGQATVESAPGAGTRVGLEVHIEPLELASSGD